MVIGFIGTGQIASIIIEAVEKTKLADKKNIVLYDKDTDKMKHYASLGYTVAENSRELVLKSDTVFLCVKPQNMPEVLAEISGATDEKHFVTVAAGITTDYVRSMLVRVKSVIRVMPNTPMLIGCGAIAVAKSSDAEKAQFDQVVRIFSFTGDVVITSEEEIDTVTALSGSGPAYFYRIADIMARYAQSQGMRYEDGVKLAAKTMQGAARMMMETGKTPAELTAQVTSPGGTTLAALQAFDERNLDEAVRYGLEKCRSRARELKK